MVEGKVVYKTRLCVLYKKGHCPRQTCSFAHGHADLRPFITSTSSFNGRRDYHASDLRDKLGRRCSPSRRNFPDTDVTVRHPSHGHHSPRTAKTSDWNHKKRQRFDDERDISGSLRMPTSLEFKTTHDEQLKQLKSEVDMLEDDKQHLEIYLEERAQEADSLNSKIKDLEMQLSSEKEEYKRISSKIRKYVKAYNHHLKIQDELKRSEARLQKLGEHLGSDVRIATDEEDINVNILSEEEMLGKHLTGPRIKQHNDPSPIKKRLRARAYEDQKQDVTQFKDRKEIGRDINGISNGRSLRNEGKPKQSMFSSPLPDKLKDSKPGLDFPITGIAAHAADEPVDVVELDEEEETYYTRGQNGQLPLPPPLPPPSVVQKAYLQYKGKDENADVDDENEMLDVDII